MTEKELTNSLCACNSAWYKVVPKQAWQNTEYRRLILGLGAQSKDWRELLWKCCSEDALFFINTFLFTLDSRPGRVAAELPFVTWPRQDQLILKLHENVCPPYEKQTVEAGKVPVRDLAIPKSRDQGATWTCLAYLFWCWQFKRMQSFLLVSRTDDYVDRRGDYTALFPKLDFMLAHLPAWLTPAFTRKEKHLGNDWLGGVFSGEATTGDIARGARPTALFLDEFAAVPPADATRALASTQAATPCRIFNSTPQGVGNAFHRVATMPTSQVFIMRWWEHPLQSRGLYLLKPGQPVRFFDEESTYQHDDGSLHTFAGKGRVKADYPFRADGKLRSPWYDSECDRMPIPSLIAQELDISFIGSGSLFFDLMAVEGFKKAHGRPALWQGDLEMTSEFKPAVVRERAGGNLRLWAGLDHRGKPANRRFAVGCDISGGTGHSNSVASVVDVITGDKVAEYCTKTLRPEGFAELVHALCWFFSFGEQPAYVIWESNGPGRQFGARIIELGLTEFYLHRVEETLAPKQTLNPGWYSTAVTKRTLFTEYFQALKEGRMLEHSIESLDEMLEYEFGEGNSIIHNPSRREDDPADKGDNHGDRVVSAALCARALKALGGQSEETLQDILRRAPNSVGSRLAEEKYKELLKEEALYDY